MIKRSTAALTIFKIISNDFRRKMLVDIPPNYHKICSKRFDELEKSIIQYIESTWFFTNYQFQKVWGKNYTIWVDNSLSIKTIKAHNTVSMYFSEALREFRRELKA